MNLDVDLDVDLDLADSLQGSCSFPPVILLPHVQVHVEVEAQIHVQVYPGILC